MDKAAQGALLAQLKGYQHQSFNANAANIDPAAELGDGVTVGGLYAGISQIRDDGYGYSDISAPDEPEVEDEYPYISPIQQEINRKSTEIYSTISKTAEEIRLEIVGLESEQASLSLSLDGLETRITGAEDELASMSLTLDGFQVSLDGKIDNDQAQALIDMSLEDITLSVSSSSGSTTFTLKAGETTLDTEKLNLTVSAVNISGTLNANQINMTGAITWSDLNSAVQNEINMASNDASSALSAANNAQSKVNAWVYSGTTYIDGTQIMTGTVTASYLSGGIIEVLGANGTQYGALYAGTNTAGTTALELLGLNGLRLSCVSGNNVYIFNGYSSSSSNLAHIMLTSDGQLQFAAKKGIIMPSDSYGYSLPTTNLTTGRVFFLLGS